MTQRTWDLSCLPCCGGSTPTTCPLNCDDCPGVMEVTFAGFSGDDSCVSGPIERLCDVLNDNIRVTRGSDSLQCEWLGNMGEYALRFYCLGMVWFLEVSIGPGDPCVVYQIDNVQGCPLGNPGSWQVSCSGITCQCGEDGTMGLSSCHSFDAQPALESGTCEGVSCLSLGSEVLTWDASEQKWIYNDPGTGAVYSMEYDAYATYGGEWVFKIQINGVICKIFVASDDFGCPPEDSSNWSHPSGIDECSGTEYFQLVYP